MKTTFLWRHLVLSALLIGTSHSLRAVGGRGRSHGDDHSKSLLSDGHRDLQATGGGGGHGGGHSKAYHPLVCNRNVTVEDCLLWSTQDFALNEQVVIPCGICVEMDVTGTLSLTGGLNVEGMLYIPAPALALTVETPHVFVQGELVIDSPDTIIPSEKLIEFVLIGNEDQVLVPHADNSNAGHHTSKKPVAIAGGTLNIRAMVEDCPTWTRIVDVDRDEAPVPDEFPLPPLAPDGCSSAVVQENFSSTTFSNVWDGLWSEAGVQTDGENQYFSVNGMPRVNLGNVDCLVPQEPYLLSFRYRLRGGGEGFQYTQPYVKMIRGKVAGGNDWINPTFVYPRGSMSLASKDIWYRAQYVISFEEDHCDSAVTSNLYLYLQTFENGATLDVDDFLLELTPPAVYPASSEDACTDLLRNSDASSAHGHAYPFYASNGGMLITADDEDETSFFRMMHRKSEWSKTLSQDLNPECLVAGAAYKFRASVRIHSATPRSASVQVWTKSATDGSMGYYTVTNCPESSFGEWVVCEGLYTFSEDHENSSNAWFHTRIGGDATSMVDWANVTFTYHTESGSSHTLQLEEDVSSCWGPGAEVLITSHTVQWDDVQVATIESVDSTTGAVTLMDSILSPITLRDDAVTGVEIALLSRNVVFRAEESPTNPLIGGHLIVLHTPGVAQTLMGVEMNNFGQQGNLGRYPIHFHMCGSVAGSVVKKNLVRNSNQRCIVVHGSDELDVIENVAYDTSGHCIILEDGAEQNNRFIRNLVSVTRPVDITISEDESDDVPSSFWITNAVNSWISNVAAGSAGPGYWFEVRTQVRGPSKALHPDVIPQILPLKLFIDNVSHSNSLNGLQTYPQIGYKPSERAVFQNHKSYRNRGAGIFFHAGGQLTIDGGYFADNRVGIDIDVDHSDEIKNAVIVGVSEAYQSVVDSMGAAAYLYPAKGQCTGPVIGVRLDASGTTISNVTFSGFGSSSCEGSSVLDYHEHRPTYNDQDSINQVSILDDAIPVNLCNAVDYGVVDIAIHDQDGSILNGTPGYIVSDTHVMRSDNRCTPVEGTCTAACPGVLLRTLSVLVPSYTSSDIQLRLEGTSSDGQSIQPVTFKEYYPLKDYVDLTSWNAHRTIYVKLPAGGSYSGRFTIGDDSTPIWPVYASMIYKKSNDLALDFEMFELEQPDHSCDELIVNGDVVGGSTDSWQHVAGGVKAIEDGPDGGSGYSLLNTDRIGRWHGLAQYLDTRCMVEGTTYDFQAMIKLTDQESGNLFQCDMDAWSADASACPRATLRSTHGLDHQWHLAGKMIENDKEWNVMQGTFTVSEFDASAGRVAVYINGAPEGINIQMSLVSIIPFVAPSSSPSAKPRTVAPSPYDHTIGPVSVEGDGTIVFSSTSGEDATVLTKAAHEGDVEIIVEIIEREMFESGYQAALALFFADPNDELETFEGNDNTYGNFEARAVATIKDKLYPTIIHCWFSMKNQAPPNGSLLTSTSGGASYQMLTGGKFKLLRSNGQVSAQHFSDGAWVMIGTPKELPDAYKTSPLKLGMRIKREWKTTYHLSVLPTIVSE